MEIGPFPEFEQDASDKLDYAIDFEPHLVRLHEQNTDYLSGARVRPAIGTGYEYECTTGGRTGAKNVRWPTTIAATVTDGSVVWTCRALSTASLKTTVSGTPTWNADTGLTVSGATISGQRAIAYITGGVEGQRYLVRVEAVMADTTERNACFWLKIRERKIRV